MTAPHPPGLGRPLPGAVDPADDGSADRTLVAALAAAPSANRDDAVAAAFGRARVFVAVEPVARALDAATGADREAEMALLTLRVPSGATAIPAFTSVGALATWRPEGRPVPVAGAVLCAEARRSGHAAVVVDPGSASSATVDGADLTRLADSADGADGAEGPVGTDRAEGAELTLRPAGSTLRGRQRRALARALAQFPEPPTIWAAEVAASPASQPGAWRPALVVGLPAAGSGAAGSGTAEVTAAVRRAVATGRSAGPELVVVDAERAAGWGPLLGPALLGPALLGPGLPDGRFGKPAE